MPNVLPDACPPCVLSRDAVSLALEAEALALRNGAFGIADERRKNNTAVTRRSYVSTPLTIASKGTSGRGRDYRGKGM